MWAWPADRTYRAGVDDFTPQALADGVPNPIVIDEQEVYGEFFDIPVPDELVFVSGFSGGEIFRSGCAFHRGHGRIFYFSPGDQEYPVYHHKDVRRVIANAVRWAAPGRARQLPALAQRQTGWFTKLNQS